MRVKKQNVQNNVKTKTQPSDLRTYLEELGDYVVEINDEIDPVHQAAILSSESDRPYMLNNLKGFPDFRLCDILIPDRQRQAVAFDVEPHEVVPYLADVIYNKEPAKEVMVPASEAPCKEVKYIGDDADVTKLPIPIHSIGDSGQYLGSGITITRDPDTGVRNEAFIRAQVKDPKKVPFWMAARHNWNHYLKYAERNEPMPMAFAIGAHPAYDVMVNYSGRHDDFDELQLGASVLDEDLHMVKCETIDLEVPAYSEIVIEGMVHPTDRLPEGPFGEFTTYIKGAEGPAPVWEITAITHRKNPIFRHIQSTHFTDHQALVALPMEATMYHRLREVHGFTDVHDVFVPPWASLFMCIVQLSPKWDGQARDTLLSALAGVNLHPKIVIGVDKDVDLYNAQDILWAISTRVDPAKDVHVIPHERIHPLDISVPLIGDYTSLRVGGKMFIDATKPAAWRKEEHAMFRRVDPSGFDDRSLDPIIQMLKKNM